MRISDGSSDVCSPDLYANAAALVAGLGRIAPFEISVAAYPDCHPDSPSPAADMDNPKATIDTGASRAITQYFFENDDFLRFRDDAWRAGIRVPIVPGILPVTNFAKVVEFSARSGAGVPGWLAELFDGLDADPGTRQLIAGRSEEHTSELQSLMRISYAVFCLKKKKQKQIDTTY